jgi:hypothetical protein
MAEEKKETPKHIDTYYKHKTKADQIIETTHHHHRQAYGAAVDKVLVDEKTGLVDYDRLKKSKNQLDFANHMTDFYVDKAISYFGLKKENEPLTAEIKKDIFKKDMLMRSYARVTQGELKRLLSIYKENFKFDKFDAAKEEWLKHLESDMHNLASQHLTDEHIDDIVKYTGADKYLVKANIKAHHLPRLLDAHKQFGQIPNKNLDKILGDYDIVKPEYRSDYEPPKEKKK